MSNIYKDKKKLLKEFKLCYWMKDDLVKLARRIDLQTCGSKKEIFDRIAKYIETGGTTIQIKNKIKVPNKNPKKITLKTKLKEGWKCNKITRDFFKKHIGQQFHFTYHLNNYAKNNPNKTYDDLIKFWKKQQKNPEKYKKIYEKTGEFEYNNFVKKYFQKYPNADMKEIIKKWKEHKKARNKNCMKVIKSILAIK